MTINTDTMIHRYSDRYLDILTTDALNTALVKIHKKANRSLDYSDIIEIWNPKDETKSSQD